MRYRLCGILALSVAGLVPSAQARASLVSVFPGAGPTVQSSPWTYLSADLDFTSAIRRSVVSETQETANVCYSVYRGFTPASDQVDRDDRLASPPSIGRRTWPPDVPSSPEPNTPLGKHFSCWLLLAAASPSASKPSRTSPTSTTWPALFCAASKRVAPTPKLSGTVDSLHLNLVISPYRLAIYRPPRFQPECAV
jgi:hypothetical protein